MFPPRRLEPAFESSISYNIGTLYMYSHAAAPLTDMLAAWVKSVQTGPRLAPWDQDPINKRVLAAGLRRHPRDKRLALTFNGRLAMGVLPMLQFTTSFTYFIHRERRESVGSFAYALHAIFGHGKRNAAHGRVSSSAPFTRAHSLRQARTSCAS